ncbi:F-box/LRR-repeat protein 12-like [Mizuhopecten yessoensis]|uniref:F-box/LRR-repeat protein 12 n=1 Tax=Mizuhopecten yessoensis TaxID=6573 RepID=A0A210PXR2_MIZYE|nr:F-box/LRR-repeat protein 12-like [Mizuhopecten yessoensis]OWF41271.1 F-box/LRR-repeat protein 12 [Mizuhopecten yessoensis]
MTDVIDVNINHLPENILLEILSYLSVKDLCRTGSVCRSWRRVVRDNTLWRHVDLLPYRLNLQKMWKVIRAHFSECLLTMKVRGFVDSGGRKQKKPSLSDAMLRDLGERCPNICDLHLHMCKTDNISAGNLPGSLTRLVLHGCSWQPRWLKGNENNLKNIVDLDLSCCCRVDSFDMHDIGNWTRMKTLKLNGLYRLNEKGIKHVATSLPLLERLELSYTQCTELAVHHISRHLKNLRHLNMSNCSLLNDSAVETLSSGLQKLEYLDLKSNSRLTISGLSSLKACKRLSVLVFDFNDDTEKQLLQAELPNCTIVNGDV